MSQGNGEAAQCDFSIIADHLQQVRKKIKEPLSGVDSTVGELLEYVNSSPGKMIRPAMVLLSGLTCGKITDEHIRVAAILEMVHNATLLHDDVIDNGQQRRAKATVNKLRGNESAVLLGDLLLSRVFSMCIGLRADVMELISSAAAKTCEGELRQVLQRDNFELTEELYFDIICDKSAALFRTACAVGALLSDAPQEQIQALSDYGENVGIAFQITDDLLDIVGDENKTGKTKGSDISLDKLTLTIIHRLTNSNADDRRSVLDILNSTSGNSALAKKLKATGSIDYAHQRAEQFAERAVSCLGRLDDGDAKKALKETARFAVKRVH